MLEELVAQAPVRPRDASRLLVLPRHVGEPEHRRFLDLPEMLGPGDVLVVNRTRVVPARLHARTPHGGRVELLLFKPLDGPLATARRYEALGKPGASLKPGKVLTLAD